MCVNFRSNGVSSLVGFTYPVLHQGTKWYVDFYAIDPSLNEMKRKKYFISDGLKRNEKKRRAAEIIEALTKQLMSGWNPWVRTDESRGFIPFDDCLTKYLDYVERMDRAKTRACYRSRVNILKEYIETLVLPIKFVYQFDEAFCNDFLDWIFLDRESSPRTRNNYRGWMYGLSEFFMTRKYIKNNPVEHINVMAEHEKYRKDLTPEMLKQMNAHLKTTDKYFYLACLMQY